MITLSISTKIYLKLLSSHLIVPSLTASIAVNYIMIVIESVRSWWLKVEWLLVRPLEGLAVTDVVVPGCCRCGLLFLVQVSYM